MPETPALECRAVTKTYPGGVHALDRVDLAVAPGVTLAVIGESGCGKSTLLRLFNRMVEPTAGEVLLAGRPATGEDPVQLRRRTGYVQQEGGLLPHWTVMDNVELVPRLLGWPAARRRERAGELLDLVGLDPARFAGRKPGELSGGQRQRVAFARSLAADPPVVLLDEPFGALDALTRADLHETFAELERRIEKTLLIVTHDLNEAFLLADRIAVMRNGAILQEASPEELEHRPADEYVERLLARRGK